MKKSITHIIFLSLFTLTCNFATAQTANNSEKLEKETILVTFKCESCTKRNKFKISGAENHLFIKAQFPIEQNLKPGEYKMTYWQNRVQQIHLPFEVGPNSENVIWVK